MDITYLDGILIGVMLISALLAMVRGFVREVLSIASWVAAAVASLTLYEYAMPYTAQLISNPQIAMAAAVGGIFLVTLAIASLITIKISDLILDSTIGALDRTLGFIFGAARGFLIVVVATAFVNWLAPEEQYPWIANAKSKPLLDGAADELVQQLPDDGADRLIDYIRKFTDATEES